MIDSAEVFVADPGRLKAMTLFLAGQAPDDDLFSIAAITHMLLWADINNCAFTGRPVSSSSREKVNADDATPVRIMDVLREMTACDRVLRIAAPSMERRSAIDALAVPVAGQRVLSPQVVFHPSEANWLDRATGMARDKRFQAPVGPMSKMFGWESMREDEDVPADMVSIYARKLTDSERVFAESLPDIH